MAKKKASLGCLFWVALILLVFVVILFNLKQVNAVLKQTGLNTFIDDLVKMEEPTAPPEVTLSPLKKTEAPAQNTEAPDPRKTPEKEVVVNLKDDTPRTTPPPQPPDRNLRRANLYFAKLLSGENLTFEPVKRNVYYTDSPLKETLLLLLKGLTPKEKNQGYMNLIPPRTKIKNIAVKNGIAYLDFSEEFRFNDLGNEGLKAQLQQIVYTTTEYTNLKGVQILIDGEKISYLGAEGLYLGKPLTRKSF